MNLYWPSSRFKGYSGLGGYLKAFPSVIRSQSERKHQNTKRKLNYNILEIQRPKILASGQRGALVYPNAIIPDNEHSLSLSIDGFDEDSLRGALLMFDVLDSPNTNVFSQGTEGPPGLEDWEGFQHTRVVLEGQMSSTALKAAIGAAYEALYDESEGQWVLTQNMKTNILPKEMLKPLTGFQMRLQKALVLPDRSVPYEEVLNFKARHTSELLALRSHIDELALEVSKSGFGGYTETVIYERFEKSLNDYTEVIRKTNFLKRLFSLDVSYSISDAVKAGLVAGGVGMAAQLSVPSIAAASAIAGVSFSITSAPRNKRYDTNPFEYIFKAHDLL